MGMILVTHNFGVVADICDRVAVMQAGTIVETAEVATIFSDPQAPLHPDAAGFHSWRAAPSRVELDAAYEVRS